MENQQHHSSQFDGELEQLRNLVREMGRLIEVQVATTTKAYIKDDNAAAEYVMAQDKVINDYELKIDNACIHIIAKRQPAASDLRLVMSIGKIVTDLERMGDEAKKVAKSVQKLADAHSPPFKSSVKQLADLASKQLKDALLAFDTLDAALAKTIITADETLDDALKATVRLLVTHMMEDPRTISAALHVLTMARAFERIGDHTTNIAEQVIYVIEGKDIRHSNSI